MADGLIGITIITTAGRTRVPRRVLETLRLNPAGREREKLLWTQVGFEVTVTKGTLQSSFRKSILSRDGTAAVPKHIREALNLEPKPREAERILWLRKGTEVVVRRGTSHSKPTD